MENPHKIFATYLETREGRYTSQKRAIVELIFKTKTHFEVEQFIDDMRSRPNQKKFSRATVYRTIKQLMEAGLLQKITTRDGKVFYEKKQHDTQHDHLICNQCGKIVEIEDAFIDQYLGHICGKKGFKPGYRSLHIYGICSDCNTPVQE